MDIKHLYYITEIDENGSLKKAAEKLNISAAAISRYLASVEEQLRYPIFIHGKKKFVPTEKGSMFVKQAHKILSIYNTALSDICNSQNGYTETLLVGASPQRGELVVSELFNAFHSLHPTIQIKIVQAYSIQGKKLLENNQLDFMICSYDDKDYENFKIYSRWSESIVLVVPAFHPYGAKNPPSFQANIPEIESSEPFGYIDIEDFSDSVFILYNQTSQARASVDEYLSKMHFQPSIVYESNSPNVIMNMVQQGNGIAFLPLYYAKQMTNVTIYQTNPPILLNHGLLMKKDAEFTEARKAFIQLYSFSEKENPNGN